MSNLGINRTYTWLRVWVGWWWSRWQSPGGPQHDRVTGRWVALYRKKENQADTKWARGEKNTFGTFMRKAYEWNVLELEAWRGRRTGTESYLRGFPSLWSTVTGDLVSKGNVPSRCSDTRRPCP